MTWTNFYLSCFAMGFAFSALSFLLGGLHWHLPFHFHFGGGPHIHTGPHFIYRAHLSDAQKAKL